VGETRRATIQEAAHIMGVSEGAIRKRVKRNTLRHDKDEDGRIYVYLDGTTHGVDEGLDEVPHPDSSALISELRDQIAYLREENRRKDEIIMQQAITMRALTVPQEAPESPESAAKDPGRAEAPGGPQEATGGAQRSWWRRMFSG
jgi:hypothetical protein